MKRQAGRQERGIGRRQRGRATVLAACLLVAAPVLSPAAHAEDSVPAVSDALATTPHDTLVRKVSTVWGARLHSLEARAAQVWSQHGVATWYGRFHAGRRTSSGARFDPAKLTAAHPTLPMGTRLLVTNQDTGQSVVVTVNDREPQHQNSIVDLSRGAAARIGMVGAGTADVVLRRATAADLQAVEVAEAPADAVGEQPAPEGAAQGYAAVRPASARTVIHRTHGLRHRRPAPR